MEFWLSGSDVPTPAKTPSPTKDPLERVDTPPGPPTPEKHVTIVQSAEEEDETQTTEEVLLGYFINICNTFYKKSNVVTHGQSVIKVPQIIHSTSINAF